MIHVRGVTVHSTTQFVRETYGNDAHDALVRALPLEAQVTFTTDVRDAAWKPLDHVLAYMREGKARLAATDDDYFRRVGFYAGRRIATSPFRAFIGGSPLVAIGRAAFMWRFLYDSGRPEVVSKNPGVIVMRILDFPVHDSVWCVRVGGFLEAVMDASGARRPAVRENCCRASGAPFCEMRGTWE